MSLLSDLTVKSNLRFEQSSRLCVAACTQTESWSLRGTEQDHNPLKCQSLRPSPHSGQYLFSPTGPFSAEHHKQTAVTREPYHSRRFLTLC